MATTQETIIPNASQVSRGAWQPSLVRLVCGGLVGSLIGLGIYRGIYPIFSVPFEVSNLPSPVPLAALEKLEAYQYRVDCQNYPIVFGLTGLVVGIVSALLAMKTPLRGMILAGVLGGTLAAIGGLLAAMLVKSIRTTAASDIVIAGITIDSMMQAILTQAAIWGLMGLGVGAGMGIAGGGLVTGMKAALSGMLGGIFAAMAFVILAAVIFPTSSSSHVVPLAFLEQVIVMALSGICICGAIGIGVRQRERKGNS